MNRFLKVSALLAALGLVALLPTATFASGWLRRGCGGCGDCSAPCATTVAAPPAEVKYEERKVTRYRPVTKEREVEVCVNRMVPKEVKTTVMVPVTVKEKRKIMECIPVTKEVEYRYFELVPRIVKEKVKQTCLERRTKMVEETVPVCHVVRKQCVDDCGRCYTCRERVTEMQKVQRCVVDCVPVTREVEVCRTVCDRVERVGKRTVCEVQRREKEVEVCMIRCQPQERICKVYECVQETVKRKVQYCEMVPYTETVRVPVCPPCETCSTGCERGHRRLFGGLFNRGGCCD